MVVDLMILDANTTLVRKENYEDCPEFGEHLAKEAAGSVEEFIDFDRKQLGHW